MVPVGLCRQLFYNQAGTSRAPVPQSAGWCGVAVSGVDGQRFVQRGRRESYSEVNGYEDGRGEVSFSSRTLALLGWRVAAGQDAILELSWR
jgi:hypothetical protein